MTSVIPASLLSQYLLYLLPAVLVIPVVMGMFSPKNHFPVNGRTVIITGGSQGMGLAVAKLVSQKGANVVIVARNVEKLRRAKDEIAASAADPTRQRFHYISADVKTPSESIRIIEETTSWNNGQPPDIVWCIAGSSHPDLFLNVDVERLREQMDTNYWSAAQLAHATLKVWLKPESATTSSPLPSRHIVFTSSVLAFFNLVGYNPYSPAKAALRSLCDGLNSELNLYNGARQQNPSLGPAADVKVHTVFPATILSPGLDNENLTKPHITKELEKDDPAQTPEEVAITALKGLEKGGYLITTTTTGALLRASMLGGSPRNNKFLDTLTSWLMAIVWLFLQPDFEKKVWKEGRSKGLPGKVRD